MKVLERHLALDMNMRIMRRVIVGMGLVLVGLLTLVSNATILYVVNVACVVSLAMFLVLYLPSPWWRTVYGITIVAMKGAVLVLALAGVLRRLTRDLDTAPFDWALTLGYGLVTLVMVARTHMLWRDLHKGRPTPPPDSM